VSQLRTVQLVLGSQFLLSGCLAQYVAVMQRELRFKTLVVLDLCSALLGAAAAILFASVHPNFWALVVGSLVTQSVWLVLILPVSGWHPGLPHWAPGTGASLRFGSEVASFNVLNFFSRNIDNVLIGKFWGEAPLGYYSRAYNLMLVPLSQVIYPLGQVMTPLLARLQDEPRRYAAVYRSAIGKVLLVCIPIVTVIIACSDWLVLLLLGPRWLPAAPVLRVLAVSALL
jgi:polysaccharide transporter, PST family